MVLSFKSWFRNDFICFFTIWKVFYVEMNREIVVSFFWSDGEIDRWWGPGPV